LRHVEKHEIKDPVVVTVFFNSKPDPQRNKRHSSNFQYLNNWYQGVKKLGLNAVIFHDNLSKEIIEEYQTDKIKFFYDEGFKDQPFSASNYRWALYHNYLMENKHAKVFATDSSDVLVKQNPFPDMVNGKIYIGAEVRPMIIKKSEWCKRVYSNAYPKFKFWDRRLLNAGLVGGTYDDFMKLVEKIKSEHLRINMTRARCKKKKVPFTIDMPVLNHSAYTVFDESEIVSDEPVHSIYKKYQRNREDVWFVHK
jgi:hypothetical protein